METVVLRVRGPAGQLSTDPGRTSEEGAAPSPRWTARTQEPQGARQQKPESEALRQHLLQFRSESQQGPQRLRSGHSREAVTSSPDAKHLSRKG